MSAGPGVLHGVFGIVLIAVEAEHFVEDGLDDFLAGVRLAREPLPFDVLQPLPKRLRLEKIPIGMAQAIGYRLHVLRAKKRR